VAPESGEYKTSGTGSGAVCGNIALKGNRRLLVNQSDLPQENPCLKGQNSKRQDSNDSVYAYVIWGALGLLATFGVYGGLSCWDLLTRRMSAQYLGRPHPHVDSQQP
jgi:hypothetical protein